MEINFEFLEPTPIALLNCFIYFFDKMKAIIRNWCNQTSNHALPKIVNSNKKYELIVWSLLFLLCTFCCVYTIINDIIEYTKYQSSSNLDIIRNISAKLPSISICSYPGYEERNLSILHINDCKFKRGQFFEYESCDRSNFYQSSDFCITFNMSSKIENGIEMPYYVLEEGVGLEFNVSKSKKILNSKFLSVIHENGILPLYVHTDIRHFSILRCVGSQISNTDMSSLAQFIISDRPFHEKLSYPYGNCVDDWNTIHPRIRDLARNLSRDNFYDESVCSTLCSYIFGNDSIFCDENMCPMKCNVVVLLNRESLTCLETDDVDFVTSKVVLTFENLRYFYMQQQPTVTIEKLLGSIGYVIEKKNIIFVFFKKKISI